MLYSSWLTPAAKATAGKLMVVPCPFDKLRPVSVVVTGVPLLMVYDASIEFIALAVALTASKAGLKAEPLAQ